MKSVKENDDKTRVIYRIRIPKEIISRLNDDSIELGINLNNNQLLFEGTSYPIDLKKQDNTDHSELISLKNDKLNLIGSIKGSMIVKPLEIEKIPTKAIGGFSQQTYLQREARLKTKILDKNPPTTTTTTTTARPIRPQIRVNNNIIPKSIESVSKETKTSMKRKRREEKVATKKQKKKKIVDDEEKKEPPIGANFQFRYIDIETTYSEYRKLSEKYKIPASKICNEIIHGTIKDSLQYRKKILENYRKLAGSRKSIYERLFQTETFFEKSLANKTETDEDLIKYFNVKIAPLRLELQLINEQLIDIQQKINASLLVNHFKN